MSPSTSDPRTGGARSRCERLERGRAACEQRSWADAHRWLLLADQESPLGVEDLELLATAAYLVDRDDDYLSALDRAHRAYLDGGEPVRAVRCAFWLGLRFMLRGDSARATGWHARAKRLLDNVGEDCAEQGYLLIPLAEQQLGASDWDAARATAARAFDLGELHAEPDLVSCALHLMGRALMGAGEVEAGLALLDEAMVAVTASELSPVMTGLIYCSVIDACHEFYALARAREWTAALTGWCEAQPQMVAFSDRCLVHRAEIMQLSGDWPDAIEEARRACERSSAGGVAAAALYRQGEVHRLRGEVEAAEEAYRCASQGGCEPQPGLALLRLSQGRLDAATAAIRRVVGETRDPLKRAKLLPAYVEIMLAAGEIDQARRVCCELVAIAESFDTDALAAMAANARGAVELAAGDAAAALGLLRRACELWRRVDAPYEVARVRMLAGLSCRSLGDDEGASLELEAARVALEGLGASPDLARLDASSKGRDPGREHGLTPRELEVLRLVADGKTNKAIASVLFISEKTVDRHLSNVFDKLGVSSRAAATAYACRQQLV